MAVALLRQACKLALASGLSWWICQRLGAPTPVFAVLAVIVTMQASALGSLAKGLERLLGVVAGVALGSLAVHLAGVSAFSLALLMLGTALAGRYLAFGSAFNTQVSISALLTVAAGGGLAYGLARTWETACGGLLGVLVAGLLWPMDPAHRLQRQLERARVHLAADIVAAAEGGRCRRRAWRALLRHAAEADAAVGELAGAEPVPRWLQRRWVGRRDRDRLASRVRLVAGLYGRVRPLAEDVAAAERAGCLRGQPDLQVAARAAAAACSVIDSPEDALRAREALMWLDVAARALNRYWLAAEGAPRYGAPVEAQFRHLLSDLRQVARDGLGTGACAASPPSRPVEGHRPDPGPGVLGAPAGGGRP
jgi:uncharacterized membrane protein YccC